MYESITPIHTQTKTHRTSNMSPSTNTRWCPTPEQLMILEELYRRGLRTPNASQIQKITAHLAFYGKIQGKNVFYWFQNHKARDRQKLRKKIAKQLHQQQLLQPHLYHNYQLIDPRIHYSDINTVDFLAPSHFHQQFNSYSAEISLPLQGTGVCEDGPEGVMRPTMKSDLPRDCLIRTCGHDSIMIMDVGPTFPCCSRMMNNKPLQTLQLFPLRSPTADENGETSITS